MTLWRSTIGDVACQMRNNVFISRAMFKLPRVIKRGSPYGFAYKQIISAKIGEDGDANEGKYGNVHITMVNGGPVIELFVSQMSLRKKVMAISVS